MTNIYWVPVAPGMEQAFFRDTNEPVPFNWLKPKFFEDGIDFGVISVDSGEEPPFIRDPDQQELF